MKSTSKHAAHRGILTYLLLIRDYEKYAILFLRCGRYTSHLSQNSVFFSRITVTNLLFAGKESNHCKPATTANGRNQRRNNANDSFGKGFRMLKDHVLNRLMTGRCPGNHCSYGRSSTRFFSKIASIFKKVLHLKDLIVT